MELFTEKLFLDFLLNLERFILRLVILLNIGEEMIHFSMSSFIRSDHLNYISKSSVIRKRPVNSSNFWSFDNGVMVKAKCWGLDVSKHIGICVTCLLL